MEKTITFTPAYDKTDVDPNKNYGVHGVDLRFVLKGKEGAVQFLLYTNWHLPHVQKNLEEHGEEDKRFRHLSCHPQPADLGFHSLVPQYKGQSIIQDDCEYLDGKPCYYDGSSLNAEPIYQKLLTEGEKGVWEELEKYYKSTFDKKEDN